MFFLRFEGSAAGLLAVALLSGSDLLVCVWHSDAASGASEEAAAALCCVLAERHRVQIVSDLSWNGMIAMEPIQPYKGTLRSPWAWLF